MDGSGTIQYNYQYEPFGAASSAIYNVSTTSTYQFTGRENDRVPYLSEYYYRARYYNPVYQRFISQDPIGLVGAGPNL